MEEGGKSEEREKRRREEQGSVCLAGGADRDLAEVPVFHHSLIERLGSVLVPA